MSDSTDIDYDVVVIGGGGAGLAAAVTAAENGASVLLFEAMKELGGSTALSAGLFTAAGTSVQRELGIEDSAEKFFQHYMDLNQWMLAPGLIRTFCENAGPTLEWLIELGVEIPAKVSGNAHQPGLSQAGVEDVWRGHVPKDQGYGLVQVLDAARRRHGIEVVLDTRVQALLTENGRVVGVIADDVELRAGAVVVASGGFAQDPTFVDKHYPVANKAGESLFVVAADGSRGDHLRFADAVDASITGDGWGLMLPTVYFQRYHHWQSGFPPKSRVYVNAAGRRFMDEDASYAVSTGIIDHQGGSAWIVFDENARLNLPVGYADWAADRVAEEAEAGRTLRADSLDELATSMQVPAHTLKATVARWNQNLPNGEDPDFLRHRTLANKGSTTDPDPIDRGPFYAARILPAELVCTHAGLEIDRNAAVLDTDGVPIPGLFAAGEAGAGVLGLRYVGGGNAVANALTMGRIAGRTAALVKSTAAALAI
ncbi:FAD-dependent oxidoreductase [Rhodococcus sp. BP-252]|uniref:Fumarate reductase n=1 Tax=Rhodococcoides kyotonense TaxID=398843 RepID=A0A177YDN5_9NOCA|nr:MULTISPECIES: FAD-dependent oxidoreductase [Rhodococcus]MBY6414075.1 FAD-dependent oxidoreductase [Rhodococcus sp. BP-320]MBY6418846.1 FAD-dependent oxidoreductase [Rhodococcus sp. BP-321]MBY6423409.1 FAD-dependent oxidoreductase [Rhodococcus sp. BP-324]MBY6428863.1 FAD-dependent oxidoreductase [Rhodococcus sp. BP-323]MBY6433869.1 FAD-dependent oxidoreductase [Rhodococcus sp. BP-322]